MVLIIAQERKHPYAERIIHECGTKDEARQWLNEHPQSDPTRFVDKDDYLRDAMTGYASAK